MKMISRIGKAFIVAAATALLFAGCASAGKDPNAEYQLVVLHTNDHHGAVVGKEDKDKVLHGGLAEIATFVKQVRAENKNVILLDAGDINTGMAVSNLFKAEPDIKAYNAIGYDAVTFGNHEFDKTLSVLQSQMKISKFPWLSANIKQGDKYLGSPYIIKKYNGFTVGVFGLTTLRTKVIASPDKSLTFLDEIKTAKEMVAFLRNSKKCDIVIELGHLGDIQETPEHETSVKVAEQVPGIDLIIDGHAHSYFAEPKVVNGTPIVTANEQGKYVGEGVMTIKGGKVTKFTWKPVEITNKAFPEDAAMNALLKPYIDAANADLKKVVMTTSDEFPFGKKWTRYQEMATGDMLGDATVAYLKKTGVTVDFAIHNGGNIRTNLPKGPVTKEQIVTMLPFDNYIYVLTLKGSDVKALFDFIGSINQGAGAFAQVSKEVKYTLTYDADGKNGKISDVTISGKPIDESKTYRIGTNDYLANGGDGYVVLKNSIDTFNTSMLMNTVFIDYAATLPQPVEPKTDGRITVVGGNLPQ